MDFAVSNIGDRASLVMNATQRAGHFVNVRLTACQGARDAQNLRGHDQAAYDHLPFHAPSRPRSQQHRTTLRPRRADEEIQGGLHSIDCSSQVKASIDGGLTHDQM
jgi:hypothetical protein